MSTDRLCPPSNDLLQSSGDGDDEELLLYLYKMSSDSRTRCYDCISMGELARVSRDSSDPAAGSDLQLLSRSTEQICGKTLSLVGSNPTVATQVPGVVRSCRSQENYFELSDMICVDIDIDENLASSVDALHYRESVVSRTSDLSGSVETVELESGDQSVPVTTPVDHKTPDDMVEESSAGDLSSFSWDREKPATVTQEASSVEETEFSPPPTSPDVDEQDGGVGEVKPSDDVATSVDDEGEFQGRACLKDADRPSAGRLAKRLFYLQGFRKTDVSPHLTKK